MVDVNDSLPERVRIREVGPRDGFQNEPEVIPTAVKIRLIELLVRTGLQRIELTSFVRADVIPQLADAAEVMAAVVLPAGVEATVLIPNERGLEDALRFRDRFQQVSGFLSASETHNRKNLRRSVDESLDELERLLARVRAEGLRAGSGDQRQLRLPLRGARRARARLRDRAPTRRGGRTRDRLRRHDRNGEPGRSAVVLHRGARPRSIRRWS